MLFMQQLQYSSDNEAANLLARLRLGESIEQLIDKVLTSYTENLRNGIDDTSLRGDDLADNFQQSWSPVADQPYFTSHESRSLDTVMHSAVSSMQSSVTSVRTIQAFGNPLYSSTISPCGPLLSKTNGGSSEPGALSQNHRPPQTPLNSAAWPANSKGTESATGARPRLQKDASKEGESTSTRRLPSGISMRPPRRQTPRTYSGFLWPCSPGDGMPGISPQIAVRGHTQLATEASQRGRENAASGIANDTRTPS
ncbi:hypothetical protein LTR86_011084 [Recurvomyces mirabilis]|nr:hypothetical protein LTR86_011084 [Recurvomyces mirabilis]